MTGRPTQGGIELLVYQISQLEKAVTAMSTQFSSFQEQIIARVQSLEQSNEEARFKAKYLLGLSAGIGGIVGFIVNLLVNYYGVFKK